ncbi:unnamed protein product [Onchocerca ochengi]|uniref:Pollen-specific leucine-rich repeat extensin-like protein 2 n=1 Tax=Onchocerca ochengi TaxID=42157 RepID=A0A182DYX4_ONCOC|nr:unnamed protein product [Onchocerca ochengi]
MLSCTLCSCCSRSSTTSSVSASYDPTINPLSGFGGKESLETYMWEQSLKVEPKDPDKMEFIKSSRPAHVLKSPGIKPPKVISSTPSTSGPSNHYSGHRASGRGFSALNNYSSNVSHSSVVSHPNFLPSFEERNSHLGMIEITPGQQPRYLGDAKRDSQQIIETEPRIPSIMPKTRHRNDKASSTPSSPHSSQNGHFIAPSPPPLYPRQLSTQEHLAPPPPPIKILTHAAPDFSGPVPPHSAPFYIAHPDSFVFPPYGGNAVCSRVTVPLEKTSPIVSPKLHLKTSPTTSITTPTVPPRKKMEQLPSPLSDDAVRIVWNKEAQPTMPDVSAVISLPSSSSNSIQNNATTTPRLYPRRTYPIEPPPRPPKLFNSKKPQELSGEKAVTKKNGSESPPPLPPKTYKRKQPHSRPS